VTAEGLKGIDVSGFYFDCDLFESLLTSCKGFLDFAKIHWNRILYAVFVFQVQPLDPDFRSFIALAQPTVDGKTIEQRAQLSQDLKVICGRERIINGAFTTGCDSGYGPVHETHAQWNLELFEKIESEMPNKQHYRAMSDLLHLLKCARLSAEEPQ
jgi:hypothetical protein